MIIGTIIFFAIFITMLYFIKVDIISKRILTIYLIVTGIILSVSMCNPVGLYPVSNYTYFLWIINIIFFTITLIIVNKKYLKNKYDDLPIIDINKCVKSKLIIIIGLIELGFLIYYKIKYESIISTLPNSQMRIVRFTLLFNGAFETLFYNYIISGVIGIFSMLFAILLVNKKVFNIQFILIFINIILFTLIGYGRMTIFNTILYIIITILLQKKRINCFKFKNILKCIITIILIFTVFVAMICVRMKDSNLSNEENIKKAISNQATQIFEYFGGGFRMLDEFVKNGFQEFEGNTYGRATLAGFDEIILYPLKGIGIEIDSFNNIAANIMEKTISVGENTPYFNAFYTCVMNYYLDFGIIGVIVIPMIYAILISIAIYNHYKRKNIYSLLLLNYVVMNLIMGILKWNYQGGSNVFILMILILINGINNYQHKVKKEKNL